MCTEILAAERHPVSQYLAVPVTAGDTTSKTAELCAPHSRLLLLRWRWRRLSTMKTMKLSVLLLSFVETMQNAMPWPSMSPVDLPQSAASHTCIRPD